MPAKGCRSAYRRPGMADAVESGYAVLDPVLETP